MSDPIIHRHAKESGVAHRIEIVHGNSDDVKIRGKFDVVVSELFSSDAFGAATVNSFVRVRERFLAPNGVLIPQKLAMFAVPSKIENSIQDTPANLPIKSNFLKSLKLNYAANYCLSERPRIKFLAKPQKITEVDFRIVENSSSSENFTAEWELKNLPEANAFTLFNHSIFTDEIKMDAFDSQS